MRRLLLLTDPPESTWANDLTDALDAFFAVEKRTSRELRQGLEVTGSDLIVIDATSVGEVPSLIALLRRQDREVPIVVSTASPTWNQARDAFLAGATDYVHRSSDPNALVEIFAQFL